MSFSTQLKSTKEVAKNSYPDVSILKEGQEYEKLIQNYKGEDPLRNWRKYLKWADEAFAGTNDKSVIIGILERCTRVLQGTLQIPIHASDNPHYKNDDWYTRIWADTCSDPISIFEYMKSRNIGQRCTVLYEAWACVLEKQRNYQEAEKMYELGIQIQAVPLDRLEQSYMYFQMRKRRKQMKAQKANKQNKPINNENMINSQSSGTHQPSATLPPPPPLNNSFMDVLAPAASQPLPLRKGAIVDRLQTPTASGNNVAPRGKPGPPGSKEFYDPALLLVAGDEYSFEEIRATKQAQELDVEVDTESDDMLITCCTDFSQINPPKRAALQSVPQGIPYESDLSPTLMEVPLKPSTSPLPRLSGLLESIIVDEVTTVLPLPIPDVSTSFQIFVDENFREQDPDDKDWRILEDQENKSGPTAAKKIVDSSRVFKELPVSEEDEPHLPDERGKVLQQRTAEAVDSTTVNEVTVTLVNPIMQDSSHLDFEIYQDPELASPKRLKSKEDPKDKAPMQTSVIYKAKVGEFKTPKGDETDSTVSYSYSSSSSDSLSYSPGSLYVPKSSRKLADSGSLSKSANKSTLQSSFNFKTPGSTSTSICSFPSPAGSVLSPSTNRSLSAIRPSAMRVKNLSDEMEECQVNPFIQEQIADILSKINPPLSEYRGFYDMGRRKAPSTAVLQDIATSKKKSTRKSMFNEYFLELDRCSLEIDKCIGKGGFGNVFLVNNVDTWTLNSNCSFALKVQSPPCSWEFYISSQIQQRAPAYLKNKFCKPHSLHLYQDTSFLLMDYGEKGTLQDVINGYKLNGNKMDESLVMYYTIEMLHMIELLQSVGIIHGDIKPDNLLVLHERSEGEWHNWQPGFQGGWDTKGLKLIDFGRSIDTKLYPDGTHFKGDSHVDSFRCIEMQTRKPWTYQVDIFGVCAVIHCLLHGTYMETVQDAKTKRWRAKETFKRYWQADLWSSFFDACMNIEDCSSFTVTHIAHWRKKFEQHLESDPQRSKSIKSSLCKQDLMMSQYEKQLPM